MGIKERNVGGMQVKCPVCRTVVVDRVVLAISSACEMRC